ncbi:HD domain-containing protein [Fructilactobacillus florum]|uniref:HD/PDEase domain-containing protein n=1 Tax=Fructilactobacillus florum DSM 22689 = JCM 16035 TaxID=1423745 RepID=A0A0R2CF43_9LACO|nr:HD domain-containing protein [Fructilactobacillus florum]KRM89872.1 hypothetical protein FC87_GL000287 [Fructilactobacillus florum DSM 22689 = JCM 16035]
MAFDHSGHGFDHIERVVNMTGKLLASEPANGEVALTAAYLHDVFDEKLCDHRAEKRQEVINCLQDFGYHPEEIKQVLEIIDHLSFADSLEQHHQLSKTGQVVQDADRLDSIGAIGVARTFAYGAVHGAAMYDPKLPPRRQLTKAEYRNNTTTLNHFYEKLFLVADQMNTKTAQQLAKRRKSLMETFVQEFKAEWSGQT